MTNNDIRKLDCFQREGSFFAENVRDFPTNSPAGELIISLNGEIERIKAMAARQIAGLNNKSQGHGQKDEIVAGLRRALREINLVAQAMNNEINMTANKFRLSRRASEQVLLATARAFLTEAAPLKADFIKYGLPLDFLEKLTALIAAYDESKLTVNNAASAQGAATGALKEAFRRASQFSKNLDFIVKVTYRDDPMKLAAWNIASHLERPPKREKEQEPAT